MEVIVRPSKAQYRVIVREEEHPRKSLSFGVYTATLTKDQIFEILRKHLEEVAKE